jgi:hypothetical protein
MALIAWIVIYILSALFWLWILKWGGAKWLEGWRAFFIVDWFTGWWTAEQLRLYALCVLVLETIWFFVGLANPELRF